MNEMNVELKTKLQKIISLNPMNYAQICASRANAGLFSEIMAATKKLDGTGCKLATRIFWIMHNITDFPICCVCGKPVKRDIKTFLTGYNKVRPWEEADIYNTQCGSLECSRVRRRAEAEKTFLKKYGVKNPY